MTGATKSDVDATLASVIDEAKQKLNIEKDILLCRYLPSKDGGHMHHFTFAKFSKEQPEQLIELIRTHILEGNPTRIPGKQRKKSAKAQKDAIQFTRDELSRLKDYLRKHNDTELMRKIKAHSDDFNQTCKALLASIRAKRLQPELWDAYVAACEVRGIPQTSLSDSE